MMKNSFLRIFSSGRHIRDTPPTPDPRLARKAEPRVAITSPDFVYTSSVDTDVTITFKKARKRLEKEPQ
jgi:hypothetical protein